MAGFWRKPRNVVGVGVLAVFFGIALVGAMSTPDAETDTGDSPELRRIGSLQVCEEYVSDRLKSPASARFTGGTSRSADGEEFTVTGAVDAENSFGAALRSGYTCTVRLTPDGSRWNLLELSIR